MTKEEIDARFARLDEKMAAVDARLATLAAFEERAMAAERAVLDELEKGCPCSGLLPEGDLSASDHEPGCPVAHVRGLEVVMRHVNGRLDELETGAVGGDRVVLKVSALPWTMPDDGTRWTAFLTDGRMAVVERLDDEVSFLPRISAFGKGDEEAVGPVCDGLMSAARWCEERAADVDTVSG